MKAVALLAALVVGAIVCVANMLRGMGPGGAMFSAIITMSVVYVMMTPDKPDKERKG